MKSKLPNNNHKIKPVGVALLGDPLQKRNTQSGITLVALIITVIVLLILAMVSIRLVMNGGIIDRAEKGTASYSSEEELEQIKLAVASAKLAGNGFLTEENLNTELQKVFNNQEKVSESSNSFKYKNNKTYTINKDGSVEEYKSILLSSYQEVEYLESTGTQYIDTKYLPNSLNTKMEIKYKLADLTNASSATLFNSGIGSNIASFDFVLSGGGNDISKARFTMGANWNYFKDYDATTDICVINIDCKNSKFYINNTEYTVNSSTWTATQDLKLFNSKYVGKFYYCKILDNETLIRNFIPCYSTTTVTDANGVQKPANTKGLYDTVEGKFYTNQGSGADFTAGPNL